jgi:hypothetical protein
MALNGYESPAHRPPDAEAGHVGPLRVDRVDRKQLPHEADDLVRVRGRAEPLLRALRVDHNVSGTSAELPEVGRLR